MDLPDRHTLIGMVLGAACATALAYTGPGMVVESFADEMLDRVVAPGFDTSKLVRFEGKKFLVESEDWVATDPLATTRVKKVEAGRVSYVTITTTDTGTYSSDAMFARNVQYPGISVEEVPRSRGFNRFFYWGGGRWHGFVSGVSNSFFSFRSGDTRTTVLGDITCVSGKNYHIC